MLMLLLLLVLLSWHCHFAMFLYFLYFTIYLFTFSFNMAVIESLWWDVGDVGVNLRKSCMYVVFCVVFSLFCVGTHLKKRFCISRSYPIEIKLNYGSTVTDMNSWNENTAYEYLHKCASYHQARIFLKMWNGMKMFLFSLKVSGLLKYYLWVEANQLQRTSFCKAKMRCIPGCKGWADFLFSNFNAETQNELLASAWWCRDIV